MNKPEYRIWPVKKSNSRWHAYQNHDLTCRIVRVYDSMEPPRVKSWLESKTECNQVSLRRLMRVNVDLWVCTEFAGLGKMEMASVRLFRFSLFLTTLHQYRSASIKSFFFFLLASCSVVPSFHPAIVRQYDCNSVGEVHMRGGCGDDEMKCEWASVRFFHDYVSAWWPQRQWSAWRWGQWRESLLFSSLFCFHFSSSATVKCDGPRLGFLLFLFCL